MYAIYTVQDGRQAHIAGTVDEVSTWLWGKHCAAYVIYAGECPYRFFTGDLGLVRVTLTGWPPWSLARHHLPSHCIDGEGKLWAVIGSCECQRCQERTRECLEREATQQSPSWETTWHYSR